MAAAEVLRLLERCYAGFVMPWECLRDDDDTR